MRRLSCIEEEPDAEAPYALQAAPEPPSFAWDRLRGLRVRIAWKCGEGGFLPMSFVVDTGLPRAFYFSERALQALAAGGRLVEDGDGNPFVRVLDSHDFVYERAPGNAIGLAFVARFGLHVVSTPRLPGRCIFRFGTAFEFL